MKLDDLDTDINVEDQRGSGGGGFRFPMGGGGGLPVSGRMGCGTIAIIVIAALVFGVNPMTLLGGGEPIGQSPQTQTQTQTISGGQGASGICNADAASLFSCRALRSTDITWSSYFQTQGANYRKPALVFYSGNGQSGCGAAQSAMGPFYCPSDEKIYLDTAFFDELQTKFGAGGDFPIAYVIAHEVGHHIQKLIEIGRAHV